MSDLDCTRKVYKVDEEAFQCLPVIEKRAGQPHYVETVEEWVGSGISTCFRITGYSVVPSKTCYEGAKFDDYIGSNHDDAKACAERLKEITGNEYRAVVSEERTLFANVYKAVLAKK